ncbi:MAG TPA: NAD(P)-dependent oxidoreductase [Pyrinomonadaceae bacterium]|nr:NAD(P)-dependent oxidoreductase [Pyrinomonadaceae bacterium]
MANSALERILVTGGTGFIGRHVVNLLTGQGYRPLITTFSSASGPEFVKLDVTDPGNTRAVVDSFEPQIVIHLAGVTGHDDATGEKCRNVNYLGTLNLLNSLEGRDVSRVILIGSASEYGHQPIPFQEDMTARPVSAYGLSKTRATEAALERFATTGLPVTILRVFSAFGEWQPNKLFLSQLLTHALLNRDFKMSDGLQRRDYIYAADVAMAITAAMLAEPAVGRVINIGSGRGTVLHDLARYTWALCGADEARLHIGAREKSGDDAFDTEADISLAADILGWAPQNSLLPTPGRTAVVSEMIAHIRGRVDSDRE